MQRFIATILLAGSALAPLAASAETNGGGMPAGGAFNSSYSTGPYSGQSATRPSYRGVDPAPEPLSTGSVTSPREAGPRRLRR